mmetsp:Transcript_91179/g.253869  ORF Transcript_91179/g.253869 Transcript_91179/m.253869 type:complete len:300 (-) Transcript_91179:370-1269(-)
MLRPRHRCRRTQRGLVAWGRRCRLRRIPTFLAFQEWLLRSPLCRSLLCAATRGAFDPQCATGAVVGSAQHTAGGAVEVAISEVRIQPKALKGTSQVWRQLRSDRHGGAAVLEAQAHGVQEEPWTPPPVVLQPEVVVLVVCDQGVVLAAKVYPDLMSPACHNPHATARIGIALQAEVCHAIDVCRCLLSQTIDVRLAFAVVELVLKDILLAGRHPAMYEADVSLLDLLRIELFLQHTEGTQVLCAQQAARRLAVEPVHTAGADGRPAVATLDGGPPLGRQGIPVAPRDERVDQLHVARAD